MKDTKRETKLVPKLRFTVYEDLWHTEYLKNVSIRIGDGLHSTPNYDDSGEYYFINGNNIQNGKVVINASTKRVNQGEFIKHDKKLRSKTILLSINGTIGNTAFYDNEPVILGKSASFISVKDDYCNEFIYHQITTPKIQRFFQSQLTGTTIRNLSLDTIRHTPIGLPSIEEQQKIASFLTAVDKRIEQLTKKKKLLEEYKKGVMQRIFNQEIRFKDENGNDFPDWEEIKIGEILKERNLYEVKGNGIEHVSLTIEGVVAKTDQYNRDFLVRTEDKKYKVTYKNDICYNPANLKFGVICRNTYGDGIFSPIYVTFGVTNSDPEFVEFLVTSDIFINKARRFEEGTVYERQAVKPSDFIKTPTKIPTLPEQKVIVKFIYKLDSSISGTYIMLDHSKQFKKSLLQQMFI